MNAPRYALPPGQRRLSLNVEDATLTEAIIRARRERTTLAALVRAFVENYARNGQKETTRIDRAPIQGSAENPKGPATINRDDTSIDLIQHVPSGELYLARFAATWDVNGRCVGAVIIELCGPVVRGDWLRENGWPIENWDIQADYVLTKQSMTGDVEWANSQSWQNVASSV